MSAIEIGDCMMLEGEACANSAAVNCGAGVSVTLKTGGRPAVKVATSDVGAGVKVWAGGGGRGGGALRADLIPTSASRASSVRFKALARAVMVFG